MPEWFGYLMGAVSAALTGLLGMTMKLLWNHLAHMEGDIREMRALMIDHLKDHSK